MLIQRTLIAGQLLLVGLQCNQLSLNFIIRGSDSVSSLVLLFDFHCCFLIKLGCFWRQCLNLRINIVVRKGVYSVRPRQSSVNVALEDAVKSSVDLEMSSSNVAVSDCISSQIYLERWSAKVVELEVSSGSVVGDFENGIKKNQMNWSKERRKDE